jgi:hypothetical protein
MATRADNVNALLDAIETLVMSAGFEERQALERAFDKCTPADVLNCYRVVQRLKGACRTDRLAAANSD